jgi:demethylmenaquinone methyltransferase/2-methoxy-6-polyprenyl-1,4-benzoquinol methylase
MSKVVDNIPKGTSRLLDVGCGTGNILIAIKKRHARINCTGIDFSSAMLYRARKKLPGSTFRQLSLNEKLPFPDKYFDVVTCIKVLFAVPHAVYTIKELKRVLKDGGTLIIDSPKEGWKMMPILKEHIRQVGFLKTLPVLFRLLLLALFNLPIFKKGKNQVYHFMSKEKIEHLIETNVESVYASQDWFGIYIKEKFKNDDQSEFLRKPRAVKENLLQKIPNSSFNYLV